MCVALTGLPLALTRPFAVGAIVLLAGINYVGVAPGAITVNILTVLKLAALATVIVVGLALAPAISSQPAAEAAAPAATGSSHFGAALVPVLFTYGGWQQTNFIAEEIVAPERTLPRALVLGVHRRGACTCSPTWPICACSGPPGWRTAPPRPPTPCAVCSGPRVQPSSRPASPSRPSGFWTS